MNHNRILWVLQWVFGLYFIGVGINHFVVPAGLPEMLSWMYDLSETQHTVVGTAEILGGLGLILPSLTKVMPRLTVASALGLIVVMIGAIVFHLPREEFLSIVTNVFNIVVLGYIAYGRAKLAPIPA